MKQFARLYGEIDATNKTNEKVAAMVDYFRSAPPEDAAWAVHFLIGRRPKRLITSTKLAAWAAERAGIPDWLFVECYDAVGDLAETMALVMPEVGEAADTLPFHAWIEDRLLPIPQLPEDAQKRLLDQVWRQLGPQERFVWNKLITGQFRVGVSQDLVVRALAKATGIEAPVIAHRLMGDWSPTADFYLKLVGTDTHEGENSRPYPFCLAHPLEQEISALGAVEEWHAEWKWDGIRAQLIRRNGQSYIWSRGEDLITDRFPEIRAVCDALPEGTVVDGEILAWDGEKPMPFLELQKRIGRKTVSKRILQEVPARLVAFDLLEIENQDVREHPLVRRREQLGELVARHPELPWQISPRIPAQTWEELAEAREDSRSRNVEGLMLKRLDSPYLVGRKKGSWWKWKVSPLTVDAVLIYAQPGHGKRASLFTDYTFGVWHEGKLVPFAKAYSGLTDEEIRRVDAFVRRHTLERFGPVRTVKPELVMELAFEAIQLSNRHKSGIAVRFPRIARWRHDKRPEDADSLQSIKEMLRMEGPEETPA